MLHSDISNMKISIIQGCYIIYPMQSGDYNIHVMPKFRWPCNSCVIKIKVSMHNKNVNTLFSFEILPIGTSRRELT